MDKTELDNWIKVKQELEEAGKTDCYFYQRACEIVQKGSDPLSMRMDLKDTDDK